MAVTRATRALLLLFFACLVTFGAVPSLRAAETTGLLAILQPATLDAPAALQFYSPDATLVHEIFLPPDTALSANAISPDGQHWVALSGDVSGPEVVEAGTPLQADLALHIVRALDGTAVITIPLLPPNFPANITLNAAQLRARDNEAMTDAELAESTWQAFRFSLGTFAWSPDGTQLAFSGALDGPSSDLYLYDLATDTLTRLTDGIEQIDGIRWSPDGQWIWHSTLSYAYCQACAGHHYAAAADGSSVINLPGDDIDRFLAWVDDDTYLVTDQANGPGNFDLQTVEIASGKSTMLWAGAHQSYLYDAPQQRLGIIGTRSKTYDPNEQVFVIDLATGDTSEYDDLASARLDAPWLAPLDQFPINYPCARPGPLVYPCLETPFDALSPDGTLQVTADFAVKDVKGDTEQMPPLDNLAPGRVLWRPDGAGFFFTQRERVGYRDLATGNLTWLEPSVLLGWLPLATSATFPAVATPTAIAQPSSNPPSTPNKHATPAAEIPTITLPFRRSTLDGNVIESACQLHAAHAAELAALTTALLAEDTSAAVAARVSGLPLLLAREAYETATCPYLDSSPNAKIVTSASQALNDALVALPPALASYPPSGALPALTTFALSPDGRTLATGHSDGTLRFWDYESGTLTRVMPGAETSIRYITFSSDSTMLAATDPVGNVQMWNVTTGVQSSLHIGHYVNTLATAWRPNSYDLVVANGSDPVMVHPRDQVAYKLVPEAAEALAYNPDGTQLAVALQPLYPPPSALPARQPIVPEERPIWLVDADTGEVMLELEDTGLTYFMSYTPDGDALIVAGNYALRVWDLPTGTLRFTTPLSDFPNGWALTPAGDEIAILTRRGGISYYNVSSGENVRNMPVDASVLVALAIHPVDGTLISGEINGRPLLLNEETGAPVFHFGPPRARLVTHSPTAPLLATADIRVITLYNLDSQRLERELVGAENLISDIAFSTDGNWLAAREETGHLLLWDVRQGRLQWRVQHSNEWLGRGAFTPDNRLVITGSDGILRLVDPTAGALIEQRAFDAQIIALTVSARNEAALIVGAPNGLALRVDLAHLNDENAVQLVEGERTVRGQLAYNADGSMLALIRGSTTTVESSLELWETASHQLTQSIPLGEIYAINALAFTPDGTQIATGAHLRRPITLWDLTGRAQQMLGTAGSTSPSTRLAFGAEGTHLFATDEQAITTQYSLASSHDISTPRNQSDRQFTQQERRTYAIDTFVGAYPLSASANINLRAEPVVKSLIVQPSATGTSTETLIALTDENFLLTSTNRGESWRIVTRLPVTLTTYSLGIPVRNSDPLLLTSNQGLYQVDDEGALTLLHRNAFTAISYGPTDTNERWAIQGNEIVKSDDGGVTWQEASANLGVNKIYAPLLFISLSNNPISNTLQVVTAQPNDVPVRTLWRSMGDGSWERLTALPTLPNGLRDEQGMAWDAATRTLYLGGAAGELFAANTLDAPNVADVTATLLANFGPGTRVIPLASGQGPSLYITLLTSYAPRLLRGDWNGAQWQWTELRLPIVAAG